MQNNRAYFILLVLILALTSVNCWATVTAHLQDDTSEVSTAADSTTSPATAIDPKFGPPDWLQKRTIQDENGIYLYVQTNDPCSNPLEAEQALDQDCVDIIREVIDGWYQAGVGEKVDIDDSYIKQHLVFDDRMLVKQYKDEHTEELCRTFGKDYEYFRGYAQLQLTNDFREHVSERWKTEQTRTRLVQSGIIGASVLGLLLILFGYFHLEQATRGFYSVRLQMVGLIVILTLVAIAVWLSQTLHVF